MKLLWEFIRYHIKHIFIFVLFALISVLVFYLYSLPFHAVGYAFVLCTIIGILCFVYGFARFVYTHKSLEQAYESCHAELKLPQSSNLIDEDYSNIIKKLFKEKRNAENQRDIAISEMNDYYTIWTHQIKEPIAALNLILQEKRDDEALMQLVNIEQYVEMALEYMRLSSGVSDYVIKEYDLDGIVNQAVKKYAKSFIRKKISLKLSPINLKALTDEKWLTFVIGQIISNALKYTPAKGKIAIYTAGTNALVIEDNGIGIKKEDISRVFEKGYTGINGRRDKKATGIGLYLSKMILEKLSHTIKIESEEDKYTKVTIGFNDYRASE